MPDGTTPLRRGDEVVYRGLGTAGVRRVAVMAEAGVVKIPDDVPLAIACVLGCCGADRRRRGAQHGRGRGGRHRRSCSAPAASASRSCRAPSLAGASTIVVSDPVAERREAAKRFGATHAARPHDRRRDRRLPRPHRRRASTTPSRPPARPRSSSRASASSATAARSSASARRRSTRASPSRWRVTFTAMEKRLIGCLLGSVNAHLEVPRLIVAVAEPAVSTSTA